MKISLRINKFIAATMAAYMACHSAVFANEDKEDGPNPSRDLGVAAATAGATDIGIALGLAASAKAGKDVGDDLSEGNLGSAAGKYVGGKTKMKIMEEVLPKCLKRARNPMTAVAYPAACALAIDYAVDKGLTEPTSDLANTALRNKFMPGSSEAINADNLSVSDPFGESDYNWPRDNATLEQAEWFSEDIPAGFADPAAKLPKCGPMSEQEKEWIVANLEPDLEKRLLSINNGKKNIANWTANGHYQPDIDGQKALVTKDENDVSEALEAARSELGSCPPIQPASCAALSSEESDQFEDLKKAVERAKKEVEFGEEHDRNFRGGAPSKDTKIVTSHYRDKVTELNAAISTINGKRSDCAEFQPISANAESGNSGQSSGSNIEGHSTDPPIPAGYHRIRPGVCVNSISDYIRC